MRLRRKRLTPNHERRHPVCTSYPMGRGCCHSGRRGGSGTMSEPNNRQGDANGANAEQQAASAVLDDLEALKARASQAEQERDQFLALLQRTRADFENYEKRV